MRIIPVVVLFFLSDSKKEKKRKKIRVSLCLSQTCFSSIDYFKTGLLTSRASRGRVRREGSISSRKRRIPNTMTQIEKREKNERLLMFFLLRILHLRWSSFPRAAGKFEEHFIRFIRNDSSSSSSQRKKRHFRCHVCFLFSCRCSTPALVIIKYRYS